MRKSEILFQEIASNIEAKFNNTKEKKPKNYYSDGYLHVFYIVIIFSIYLWNIMDKIS